MNNNILLGSIDLLIKNPTGDWEIWDWKSNYVSGKNEMQNIAQHYETQMKVYACLFSLIEPRQTSFTCRLLFTRLARSNAKHKDWTFSFNWTRSEISSFLSEIANTMNLVQNR